MKPILFVGSSNENRELLAEIASHFPDAEVLQWWQAFDLTKPTITSLIELLDRADFAIFIFGPDDVTKLRSKRLATTRDNVVFEAGLFLGRLGRSRCAIIAPKDLGSTPALHIPTDLAGVSLAMFDPQPAERSESIKAACEPIRKMLFASRTLAARIAGEWVEIKDKAESPFALVNFKRADDGRFNVQGTSYHANGEVHVQWPHKVSFHTESPSELLHCYDAQRRDGRKLDSALGMTTYCFSDGPNGVTNSGHGHYIAHAEGKGMRSGRVDFQLKRMTKEYEQFLLAGKSLSPKARERELIQALSKLHRVRKFVLTGGPGSGKTELLRLLLKSLPHAVAVPEAAAAVMTEECKRLGNPRRFPRWRKDNLAKFQADVFERQRRFEAAIPEDCEIAVFDRSGIDGLAYLNRAGITPPEDLVTYASEMIFSGVFVLPTPPEPIYRQRPETGRHSTQAESSAMGHVLADLYTEFGHRPQQISAGLDLKGTLKLVLAQITGKPVVRTGRRA